MLYQSKSYSLSQILKTTKNGAEPSLLRLKVRKSCQLHPDVEPQLMQR